MHHLGFRGLGSRVYKISGLGFEGNYVEWVLHGFAN